MAVTRMEGLSSLAFAALERHVGERLQALLGMPDYPAGVALQQTRSEFEGDYTLVVFPWVKAARCAPDELARKVGEDLIANVPECFTAYNVVKGFLNLTVANGYWAKFLASHPQDGSYGRQAPGASSRTLLLEYSSPNTNKPQHLGHIRNNLLGESLANLFESQGDRVVRMNLINDRGIHICKSMIAWQRYADGATPASTGEKGDHFVGRYYVEFDRHYRTEVADLVSMGMEEEEAKAKAPILLEAHEMLRQWEAGDPKVRALWQTMNGWVYVGFDITYKRLGVRFDRIYHESQTYLLGKEIVAKGLADGVCQQRPDGSIWVDLRQDGLDEKLLQRSDGTSVYITQDIGTAVSRYEEYHPASIIYVVGSEQEYHFQVLRIVLGRLGYSWNEAIAHMSYGMVNLPHGRMKSREGTVVDADDLMDSLEEIARSRSEELGKLEGMSEAERLEVWRQVALGALKYYILKVDPAKTMLFDPEESIDFNGNTGPFVQYTHARACSLLRKAEGETPTPFNSEQEVTVGQGERLMLRRLHLYPSVLAQAAQSSSPAMVANYLYELAREFNQFYQGSNILREENPALRAFRLQLVACVATTLRSGLSLLGIEAPPRM